LDKLYKEKTPKIPEKDSHKKHSSEETRTGDINLSCKGSAVPRSAAHVGIEFVPQQELDSALSL
jgi:hypothetical protein